MNQKLLSSLTVSLLISSLGTPPSGNAEQLQTEDQTKIKTAYNQPSLPAVDLSQEIVKVGAQQSKTSKNDVEAIARVYAHKLSGRKAATLYVRNIPVLTFLGSKAGVNKNSANQTKLGDQQRETSIGGSLSKSLDSSNLNQVAKSATVDASPSGTPSVSKTDPVWRASEVATRLNQMTRDGVDAKAIKVLWDADQVGQYLIKANDQILATINDSAMLPDTTRNLETDALHVTNRLRRLLGNAAPLSSVSGIPGRNEQEISLGPVKLSLRGMASWYGPGFQGNMSASGEVFNQHALTAAHRTLPFGTQVRVTNLDNGVSVIVRINDRGPFHGNRIIDLSTKAARILGLVQTGVAPVRLDVLAPRTVTAER